MRMSSATIPRYSSSSSISSSASRRRRQPRHDYPLLELPLRWRDPPPRYPPLERPMRWRDPPPPQTTSPKSTPIAPFPLQHAKEEPAPGDERDSMPGDERYSAPGDKRDSAPSVQPNSVACDVASDSSILPINDKATAASIDDSASAQLTRTDKLLEVVKAPNVAPSAKPSSPPQAASETFPSLKKPTHVRRVSSAGLMADSVLHDRHNRLKVAAAINSFSDPIPPELSGIGYFNSYEGGIPPKIGNLTKLVRLGMANCGLTGKIQSEIGEIPPSFTRLKNLTLMNLVCNQLDGNILDFISDLPELEVLQLWENNFTGSIPRLLGTNGQLRFLGLHHFSSSKSSYPSSPTCVKFLQARSGMSLHLLASVARREVSATAMAIEEIGNGAVGLAAQRPDSFGRFGRFGGKYVPETLMPLMELESAFLALSKDQEFQKELDGILRDYVGRESLLYFAERLTEHYKSSECEEPLIFLKREDLNDTGAHKINNAVAQALLAKRLGRKRIIAETCAGQHCVATATICARFGLQCIIYMDAQDKERPSLNIFRMRLLGAEVRAVHSGTATLQDATSEAIRDWVTNVETTHYILGSVVGPHPYPMMVRDFHAVIGKETRRQAMEKWGGKPDVLVACVGGGSNAMGLFHELVDDEDVRLFDMTKRLGVEPNDATYVNVLFACSNSGMLEEGRQVFSLMFTDHSPVPSNGHYACMVVLASYSGPLITNETSPIIESLETCCFDKVKPLRDSMEALQVWKKISNKGDTAAQKVSMERKVANFRNNENKIFDPGICLMQQSLFQ